METIAKKTVFLALDDVLVPGRVSPNLPVKNIPAILDNLSALSEKQELSFYLVSGHSKEVVKKKLEEHSIGKFFKPSSILCASDGFVDEREALDKERYEQALRKDPFFNDEYIKVQVVQSFIKKGIPKEEIIYFGHDLVHDAFYLNRYCGVDTALARQSLSFNNKKAEWIRGLIYVSLTWPEFRKVIYGERKAESYDFLNSRVFSEIKEQLFGDSLAKKVTINLDKKN